MCGAQQPVQNEDTMAIKMKTVHGTYQTHDHHNISTSTNINTRCVACAYY